MIATIYHTITITVASAHNKTIHLLVLACVMGTRANSNTYVKRVKCDFRASAEKLCQLLIFMKSLLSSAAQTVCVGKHQ